MYLTKRKAPGDPTNELGQCSSTQASQQTGLGSIARPDKGPFFVEFVCSLHVCTGFLQVLRFPLTQWSQDRSPARVPAHPALLPADYLNQVCFTY